MATHYYEFMEVHRAFDAERKSAITVIFNYLKIDNIQGLCTYITKHEVRSVLLKDELDYLDGVLKKYYGEGAIDLPEVKTH